MTTTWTVILAAGAGSRFGASKQFVTVGGERAVDRVVRTARLVSDGVVLVLLAPDEWDGPAVDAAVRGGDTRARSVRAGLAAVPPDAEVVVIHDAAHPLATPEQFRAVVQRLIVSGADAVMPVLDLVEAQKRVEQDRIVGHPSRDGLVATQTPCAFRAEVLRRAHAGAPEAVEDVELICAAGGSAVTITGDPRNVHVTTPADLEVARALAAWTAPANQD